MKDKYDAMHTYQIKRMMQCIHVPRCRRPNDNYILKLTSLHHLSIAKFSSYLLFLPIVRLSKKQRPENIYLHNLCSKHKNRKCDLADVVNLIIVFKEGKDPQNYLQAITLTLDDYQHPPHPPPPPPPKKKKKKKEKKRKKIVD
jgi:hypothetical protein